MSSRFLLLLCTSVLNFWFTQGITDGKDASIQDFPYMVEITPDSGDWGCGGTIISNNWVLTIIHCVLLKPPSVYTVRAGTDLKDTNGTTHQVFKIIKHENFSVSSGLPEHNIALVGVIQPFLFYDYPFPIKLVDADFKLAPGRLANVTGFGRTFRNDLGDPHLKLQSVEVPVMSTDDCNVFSKVPKGQFCASQHDVGGKNACYHDEGGPLVIDGQLAGIVSHVPYCSDQKTIRPVLYIDVSYYRQWVDEKMKYNLNVSPGGQDIGIDRYAYRHD